MKSLALAGPKEALDGMLAQALQLDPHLVFLFIAPSLLRDQVLWAHLAQKLEGRYYIGCSTAGEISANTILADSVSLLAMRFDTTQVRTSSVPLTSSAQSFEAGAELAESLQGPKLKAIILFGPGTNVNGSGIIDGVLSVVGRGVSVSGGLAADENAFEKTTTFCDGSINNDHLVGVGLYGDQIVVSCGSEGGWRPFGPARRVTKSEGNILYELDGKPALQLYKQYLGEKARQLPASGLSYPFAILRDDRTTSGVIRSALDIDHETEALVMAGDIQQGCKVCLMHADASALTQGAAQAAAEALRTHAGPEENGCALLVSCIGRRIVLGIDVEDEIEAVVDSFLPGTPIAGFYAYGEISSYAGTGRAEMHNQTMTITYITEGKSA